MALIEAVGQRGYRTTTVADILVRAGVSRKTFYKHFANKQECFLAAFDLIASHSTRHVELDYLDSDSWPDRVEAAIGSLFRSAAENPAALRLATVEVAAAGPAGIERRERLITRYQRLITDAAALVPADSAIPASVSRAIVGGVNRVLYRCVSSGRRVDLVGLVPDLGRWATSYYPTPAVIATPRFSGGGCPTRLDGGRAPGSLAPSSPSSERRGLARGNHNVSRSFVVHSQRERILDAATNLVSAAGYAAVSVDDIAEEAAVSLHAFYEHFVDKEDALLVAYEVGHAKSLAIVERAYAAQDRWPRAVQAGISALFQFLAAEPAFAHIALVDVHAATPRTVERSDAGVGAFAQMLLPGLEQIPMDDPPPALAIEAIAGGVSELCLHYVLRGRIRRLPELTATATYIALAPFLGGAQAARVASKPPPG